MLNFSKSNKTDKPYKKEPNINTLPIGKKEISQALQRLKKYKDGKSKLETRLIENENWWKLRQWNHINKDFNEESKHDPFKINTAWLWNCITSKHADLIDGYPESAVRPRRANDVDEAQRLSDIIPIEMDIVDYPITYSDVALYSLKQGAGCFGVFWDGAKNNGLGDIAIKKVDFLELFWEPGVTDIQDSREVFYTKLVDKKALKEQYPELKEGFNGSSVNISKYNYDDNIDTSDKVVVVDWYYKKNINGKKVLHYCKFVDDTVLFSSENEAQENQTIQEYSKPSEQPSPQNDMQPISPMTQDTDLITSEQPNPAKLQYQNGWYNHGEYPFVTYSIFDIEGSICGYGYTDIARGDQEAIDIITSAICKNAKALETPRFMVRNNGNMSEDEFADWNKTFVHVEGSLDETNFRQITTASMPSYIINMRNSLIDEMKETTGNRDVANGGVTSGITAASAIAAMQEAGGKISRMHNKTLYEAHKKVTLQVIELIRQFFNLPREFRLTGKTGQDQFVTYTNAGLQPQVLPSVYGSQIGLVNPLFDVEVSAQKASPYSKMEQNELALQLYGQGVFNPQNADQALALLQFMDFRGKDKAIQIVQRNQTMLKKLQAIQQICMTLAQMTGNINIIQQIQAVLSNDTAGNLLPVDMVGNQVDEPDKDILAEDARVSKSRQQAQAVTQV